MRAALAVPQKPIDNVVIPSYNGIGMKHVTTNIRFPEEQYKRLKHLAVEKRRSLSGLVRDAVARAYEAGVPATEPAKMGEPFDITKDPIWEFVGFYSSRAGRYDSDRYKDILYGRVTPVKRSARGRSRRTASRVRR